MKVTAADRRAALAIAAKINKCHWVHRSTGKSVWLNRKWLDVIARIIAQEKTEMV